MAHSASVNLRLGHRAPGRGGRRASIPLKARPTLLSSLGAFCLWEFRFFSTNLNILRFICSDHGYPAQRVANTSCPRSGRFVCGNSAFSQQISTFYGSSVQTMETRLGAQHRRGPLTPHASSGWCGGGDPARAVQLMAADVGLVQQGFGDCVEAVQEPVALGLGDIEAILGGGKVGSMQR